MFQRNIITTFIVENHLTAEIKLAAMVFVDQKVDVIVLIVKKWQ